MAEIRFKISPELYQQKRYETAKDILASVMNRESLDVDPKQRENILYHCIQLADDLLMDLGYVTQMEDLPEPKPREPRTPVFKEKSKIHRLTDILNSADEES